MFMIPARMSRPKACAAARGVSARGRRGAVAAAAARVVVVVGAGD